MLNTDTQRINFIESMGLEWGSMSQETDEGLTKFDLQGMPNTGGWSFRTLIDELMSGFAENAEWAREEIEEWMVDDIDLDNMTAEDYAAMIEDLRRNRQAFTEEEYSDCEHLNRLDAVRTWWRWINIKRNTPPQANPNN